MATTEFTDDFDAAGLDTGTWIASLPADVELARGERRDVRGRVLRAAADHPARARAVVSRRPRTPLRVSGVQSGVFSGPVGSTIGQQPFRDGVVVRESSPGNGAGRRATGYSRCAPAWSSARARWRRCGWSAWRTSRTRCAEICIFEVFGDVLRVEERGPTAAVGMGVHPFRDPAITDEFAAERVAIDVDRVPRLRRRLAARPRRLPARRRGAVKTVPSGAGLPDANDGRRVRLPGQGGAGPRPTTCPSWRWTGSAAAARCRTVPSCGRQTTFSRDAWT